MLFTKGKHREYERLMQEKPNFGRKEQTPVQFATAENKDCPYCLYYDGKKKRCSMENCIVFDD